ncbi:MAG: 30S ribosomal protein S12 methylthiotransferase RimO [Candidatus Firestonebacteria bacterium]
MKKYVNINLISLGCSKNLVDSEVMLGLLGKDGFSLTNSEKESKIIIINTCCFIKEATKESLKIISNILKNKNKMQKVVVTGCLVQRYGENLIKKFPEIDACLGVGEFYKISQVCTSLLKKKKINRLLLSEPKFIYNERMPRLLCTPSHTAYVKISEGCNNRCFYCLIPSIRGNLRSRSIESVVKEVENLSKIGVKEINLISQDTTNYGIDLYGKPKLIKLLKKLTKIERIKWIRLLYLYPADVSDELINLIAKSNKICKYIDIPLQHIDNQILRLMGRRYTFEKINILIKKIKKKIPDVILRTTFIVGYPDETEEKFQSLVEFVKKIKFNKLGVFMFSKEKGTMAEFLEGQVSNKVKNKRKDIIMKLQQKISLELNKLKIGSKTGMIVDNRNYFSILS